MIVFEIFILTVDRLVRGLAKFASWFFLPLVFTLVYEVFMRYLFNAPTAWSYEMCYFFSSFILMIGMGYTLQLNRHVNIDLFFNKMSPKTQAIINILGTVILFFPLWFIILKFMLPYAHRSFITGERNWVGFWYPIIWPFRFWVLAGTLLLFLQGFADFLRNLIFVFSGRVIK